MILLLLFIIVPLVEIGLFISVGSAIGLWPTLAIVVVTAILGTFLVRQQGFAVLRALSERINALEDPTEQLAHGAMILFSGALLLTPGFFTDALGFALLVPGFRTIAFNFLRKRIRIQGVQMHGARGPGQGGPGPGAPHGPRPDGAGPRKHDDGDVVDADYTVLDQPKGPSGWTRK